MTLFRWKMFVSLNDNSHLEQLDTLNLIQNLEKFYIKN